MTAIKYSLKNTQKIKKHRHQNWKSVVFPKEVLKGQMLKFIPSSIYVI